MNPAPFNKFLDGARFAATFEGSVSNSYDLRYLQCSLFRWYVGAVAEQSPARTARRSVTVRSVTVPLQIYSSSCRPQGLHVFDPRVALHRSDTAVASYILYISTYCCAAMAWQAALCCLASLVLRVCDSSACTHLVSGTEETQVSYGAGTTCDAN